MAIRSRGLRTLALRVALKAALLLGVSALSGCGFVIPDHVHTEWRAAVTSSVPPVEAPEEMIGLALSGGGSRAAVFASAVIEELDKIGIVQRVTHVSSVSGGGFAASYHVLNPPPVCVAPGCREAHFAAFRAAMRADLWGATLARQFGAPGRLTSPTRRAISLMESLDAAFLRNVTFGDLPPSPVLLINAARYDDGRRFVFSTLPLPEEDYGDPLLGKDALRAASFARPGCPRGAPARMPLSFAVASSAAFPGAFGPVTLEAPAACAGEATEFWHLGDGGIIENYGVETLREIVLRRAGEGRPFRRALIVSVDAELRHSPEAMLQEPDARLWTTNPGIVVDTAKTRAEAYRDLVWAQVARERGLEIEIVHLRYTDAELAEWPASCASERAAGLSVARHLAQIETGLSISDCDADLMEAAARDLVRRKLDGGAVAALR